METKLAQLKMLNQNTFFSLSEIGDNFKSKSACHIIYGDSKLPYLVSIKMFDAFDIENNTEDFIDTSNLSLGDFEQVGVYGYR